jgi:hypothetical protein
VRARAYVAWVLSIVEVFEPGELVSIGASVAGSLEEVSDDVDEGDAIDSVGRRAKRKTSPKDEFMRVW